MLDSELQPDINKKEETGQHYIYCPRFGGKRVAINCVHLDRYRACRKWCPALAEHYKTYPDLLDIVKRLCAGAPTMLSSTFSGKGVPDPVLKCRYCRFVAKTERGLKIHLKRQHGINGSA